ncbi:MAG: inositol monophosphatase, partial [Rhodospirillales bacterium]|nr:inositol monophosphatase [Rhodospirillales bacterium]
MLEQLSGIVTELGQKLLTWRDSGGAEGEWQGPSFKARADALAHDYLAGQLERLAPGLPIISEEDASTHLSVRPERYFIIDPIDGTASYANGFQGYVTQVALM